MHRDTQFGLTLPAAQGLNFTRTFRIIEEDYRSRRKAISNHRQESISSPLGFAGRAVTDRQTKPLRQFVEARVIPRVPLKIAYWRQEDPDVRNFELHDSLANSRMPFIDVLERINFDAASPGKQTHQQRREAT